MAQDYNCGPRRDYTIGNRGSRIGRPTDRPRLEESILETQSMECERKTFSLTHRTNKNGSFLRIDELNHKSGRMNTVMVPKDDVGTLIDVLDGMFPEDKTLKS